MKKIDKMSAGELRGELRATRGLLAAAKCPNNCSDGQYLVANDAWEQCQWCAERSYLIGQS